ncbi:polysaccharide biosynthesis protein [Paraburkholderia graminis]
MGPSKRIAEMACQALQQTIELARFDTAGLANVFGSSGTVVPFPRRS